MGTKFISNKDETIRLFKNPMLEYFSHIHPAVPVVVFLPVVLLLCGYAFVEQDISLVTVLVTFVFGTLIWTFIEYAIHRWTFHYHPQSSLGKRLHFLVHGIHHDYPRDSTRLVMPLLVSIPLASFFYVLFSIPFGEFVNTIFAGFIFGYICYDSIHYATHHLPMKGKIGKFLKVYHLRHHFGDDSTAYGVSNPLWDYVFRTVPIEMQKPMPKEE